jgi:hypothetical protein
VEASSANEGVDVEMTAGMVAKSTWVCERRRSGKGSGSRGDGVVLLFADGVTGELDVLYS